MWSLADVWNWLVHTPIIEVVAVFLGVVIGGWLVLFIILVVVEMVSSLVRDMRKAILRIWPGHG